MLASKSVISTTIQSNGDDSSSVDCSLKVPETPILCYSICTRIGVCLPRSRKNTIPTYLILDQDPFSDMLYHEDRPKAGNRGTTNLKN